MQPFNSVSNCSRRLDFHDNNLQFRPDRVEQLTT